MEPRALKQLRNAYRSKTETSSNEVLVFYDMPIWDGQSKMSRSGLSLTLVPPPPRASDHHLKCPSNVLLTRSTNFHYKLPVSMGSGQCTELRTRYSYVSTLYSSAPFRFAFIKNIEVRTSYGRNCSIPVLRTSVKRTRVRISEESRYTPPPYRFASLLCCHTDRSSSGVGVAGIGRASYVLLRVWR